MYIHTREEYVFIYMAYRWQTERRNDVTSERGGKYNQNWSEASVSVQGNGPAKGAPAVQYVQWIVLVGDQGTYLPWSRCSLIYIRVGRGVAHTMCEVEGGTQVDEERRLSVVAKGEVVDESWLGLQVCIVGPRERTVVKTSAPLVCEWEADWLREEAGTAVWNVSGLGFNESFRIKSRELRVLPAACSV